MPLLRKEMTRMSIYRKELMNLIEKYGRYIVINKDQHKSLELSIITNEGNPEDTEILRIHKLHPCTKIKKIINKTKLAWPNRLEESDEIQLFYNKTRMNPSEHVICSGLAFDKVNVIKAITVINKVQTKGKTIPQFNVDIDDVRMDEEFNDRTPTAPIDPALMVSDINEEDITDNFRDLITQKAEAATSTRRPKGRPRKIENLNMGETCNYNKSANLAKSLIQIAKGKDISQSGDAEIENIIYCILQNVIKGDYKFSLHMHEGAKIIIKAGQLIKNDVYHVFKENEKGVNENEVIKNLLAGVPNQNR